MEKAHGRPTKYKPEYDQMLIEHLTSGLSFPSFAGVVGVCFDTLYEWEKVHPSFSEAKKNGLAQNLLYWDKQALECIKDDVAYDEKGRPVASTKTNSTVLIFNLKNRFPKYWRDRSEVESSNTNIQINIDADDQEL